MEKILISRCLLGDPVRYDGNACGLDNLLLQRWQHQGRLVPICPEMAGGLPCPRPPAEIVRGNGHAVIAETGRVITRHGVDVTAAFLSGAEQALALCQRYQIRLALLKARSPSCGPHQTYSGDFDQTLVSGAGVTAALLQRHGIRCFDETELEVLAALLEDG